MNILLKRSLLALVMTAFLVTADVVDANPIGDFFKRLGRSISKPGKEQPAHRTSNQKGVTKRTAAKDSNTQQNPVSPSPAAEAAISPTPNATPSVRTASAAPVAKGKKRDTPFGIPVPGRQGFVTSPFSPDGNYVDVRAFTPGTEVKDPYTGKIFRVP